MPVLQKTSMHSIQMTQMHSGKMCIRHLFRYGLSRSLIKVTLTRSRGYICVRNLDFFILWVMILGICIDYRSAASIDIPILLYLKPTLELLRL